MPFEDPNMEDSYQSAPSNESHDSSDSTTMAKPVPTASILDSESAITTYDNSVHKTFDIPELLEHILSYVPALDLCRARRTSQIFRNAIDRSLVLQRNLFLVPSARAPSWICQPEFANCILIDQHDIDIAQNPETRIDYSFAEDPNQLDIRPSSHFDPIFASDDMPRNLKSDFSRCLYIRYLRTNPLDGSPVFTRSFCNLYKLTQTFDNVSGVSEDSLLHNMFLTNPPIKEVEFMIRIPFWDDWQGWVDWESVTKGCDPNGIVGVHSLTSDTGITFAQLFEYTEEAVRGQHKRILLDPLPETDYEGVRYSPLGSWCDH